MTDQKKWSAGRFVASALVPVFALALPVAAFAQDTPTVPMPKQGGAVAHPAEPTVPSATVAPTDLPPVPLVSHKSVPLTRKEAHGLTLADEWKNHPDLPRRSGDGSVVYLYGATMPTMICTPLEVCAIKLQAGEVVNDVHAGDAARWRISPANSGSGNSATTFVVVKPTDAGLTTDLFITTNRRSYTIKLVSDRKRWIPVLSFDYPSDIQAEWAAYKSHQEANRKAAAARRVRNTIPHTGGQNLANLDFNYSISGDRPSWTPLRVYTDGRKTYIQFPGGGFNNGAPALVALGRGGVFHKAAEQMVNYRRIGDRYVVDRVIERAALISGVGRDQERVVITRKGG